MKTYRVVLDGIRSFHIREDQLAYYMAQDNCEIFELTESPIFNSNAEGSSGLKTSTSVEIGTTDGVK